MSPYRNALEGAREKLVEARSALDARASTLAALRPLLPRGLRHDLARLERAMRRPLRSPGDVEEAERSLAEYEDRLEVAIAFSDHVMRERAARWQSQRTCLRWLMAGAAGVGLLTVCGLVQERFVVAERQDRAAGICALGAAELNGAVATNEAPPTGNPCGLSAECARHGRCATAADGCIVSTTEDCRSSWDCKIDGLCQLTHGRCAAASNRDCAASRQCELEGRCKEYGGECLSVSDATGLVAAKSQSVRSARWSE